MPLLTYSGRLQSKKWVRSAGSAVPSESQPQPALPNSSFMPSTSKQPKLSGPRLMKIVPKTSWKRPRDESSSHGVSSMAVEQGSSEASPNNKRDNASNNNNNNNKNNKAKKSSPIVLGRHVWKKPGMELATGEITAVGTDALSSHAATAVASKRAGESTVPTPATQIMIHRGSHTLQRKKTRPQNDGVVVAGANLNVTRAAATTPQVSMTWRRSTNEPISEEVKLNQDGTTTIKTTVTHSADQAKLAKVGTNKLVAGHVGAHPRGRKKPFSKAHGPVVKRIKLGSNQDNDRDISRSKSSDDDDDETAVVNETEIHDELADDAAPTVERRADKQLTDFAYRALSTKPRTKGRRSHAPLPAHNALVRVDPSKRPICPTFVRGKECTNERCTLRHDVPLEYCRPVCSFFQHQGMCLREDCPFRHIKLESDAIPCPSFEMLGYCQDDKCPMMHASRKKKGVASYNKVQGKNNA